MRCIVPVANRREDECAAGLGPEIAALAANEDRRRQVSRGAIAHYREHSPMMFPRCRPGVIRGVAGMFFVVASATLFLVRVKVFS